VPDDEVIEEEDATETHTVESSSDTALTTAECISDSVGTDAGAVLTSDNSQQDV